MHIEIELQSPLAKEEIFELRQFLQVHLESIPFQIKTIPAQEGEMAVELLAPILGGVIEAIIGLSLHQMYDEMLKPKIDAWLKSKKSQGKNHLGVLSTFKNDDIKVHFLENSSGETKVFDHVNYAINTDKTYALLIGSEEFEGGFTSIPPVRGNLEDLYLLLTDKLHVGLPPENVVIAHNKSNSEIEELLLKTSRKTAMETLLIYFTGHGYRTDVKKLFLIANNTRKIDDYILGGIDFDFINQVILKSSTARQKILILDACHSGIATQGMDTALPEIDVKGTYMITSSPGDEVSYFDKNGRNTYFTGMLLNVLRNGIDNSNEMLALEDLFEYTQTQLQQRNFPQPVSKSQLSIPASKFFIARNPSFSIEKLKRRPGQLISQGLMQDALYEYEVLLQKYPDDLQLRKEAENCRSQVLFTQLVNDADELFYQHHNYPAALEKYRKAAKVKADDMVQNKIRKCEERLQPKTEKGNIDSTPDHPTDTTQDALITHINSLQDDGPIVKNIPAIGIPQISNEHKNHIAGNASLQSISGRKPITIASIWLVLVVGVYILTKTGHWNWLFPTLPIFVLTSIVFGIRIKKMGNTEFLLYACAATISFSSLSVIFSRDVDTMVISLSLCFLLTFFYLRQLMKKIKSFNPMQFAFGTLVLMYLIYSTFSIISFSMHVIVDSYFFEDIFYAREWIGGLIAFGFAIFMFINWLKLKRNNIRIRPGQ
jgi:tetratricopeptide (TPR) repeat protein